MLELDYSIDIVAEASNGKEVLEKLNDEEVEVVVMDISMPVMDGIEATRHISLNYPQVSVIIISVNNEIHNFRKAMLAGAREYLVKPLSPEELNSTVKQVAQIQRKRCQQISSIVPSPDSVIKAQDNRVVSIFGTKGGVGKSVICTNLAVAMAQKNKRRVGLVDLDIQFGDIAVMMNINPRKTISELIREGQEADEELMEEYVYERNGVSILAAPNKPELSELVTPPGVKNILKACREIYQYTFVDTPSFIDEITLTALEESDLVLLVVSLDLPTIKNVSKGIGILRSLQLLAKARLVLNCSTSIVGIESRDVEKVLDMKIRAEVPSDGKLVLTSLNQGVPFVKTKSESSHFPRY